jgi:phage terminase small subunit
MATERQKRALIELVENGRNKGEALVRAGYSKKTAIAPTKVTESIGFKEIAAPVVKQLEAARQRAIDKLIKVEDDAKYRDLTDGIDKLTKNIQLLTGGDTERINYKPIYGGVSREKDA